MTSRTDKDNGIITVCTYKYDGTKHRAWRAKELSRRDPLIILDATFEEEIQHPLLGTIARGTQSLEYYWLDRWYNIFRLNDLKGHLRCYYCNINVPPVIHRNRLSYIDLDIDLLVNSDLSYTVLDEDEFAENAARFQYPAQIQKRSKQALEDLIELIRSRQFPFQHIRENLNPDTSL